MLSFVVMGILWANWMGRERECRYEDSCLIMVGWKNT